MLISFFLPFPDFGGIYLDSDTIPLKSFDDVRVFRFCFGQSSKNLAAINAMLASQNADFLEVWMKQYDCCYRVSIVIPHSSHW